MKRSLRRALWAGAVVAVTVAAVPVTTAFGAGSVTATLRQGAGLGDRSRDEGDRHQRHQRQRRHLAHRVRPARRAPPSAASWDADVTSSGNHYVAVKKSWAGPLAPGRLVQLGLQRHRRLQGAAELHHQRRALRRRHPADHHPADHHPDRRRPHPRPRRPPRHRRPPRRRPAARRSSATSPSGASTAATTTSRTSHTSGSAAKLTHILYAFGNTTGGQCAIGDTYADYDKAYTAADSVDGVADTWDQPLRGSFNQLRKLKKMYPNLKVIWSFGGWTWSGGFTQAAQNPAAFADSCYNLVEDPRWADVFDGIDIDWEYPNACGLQLRHQRPERVQERDRPRCGPGSAPAPWSPRRSPRTAATAARSTPPTTPARAEPQLVHADDVRLLRRVRRRRARRPRTRRSPRTPASRSRASTPTRRSRSSRARASRRASCCSASASTAAAGPASPRPLRAAPPPAPAPGHLRGGHRGLQGAQEHLPGHRHGRRHRVRQVRQQLVELRHPGAPSAAR